MGCAPVCSSFPSAITPPCRSKEHPRGVPWCSEKQQVKNQIGNEQVAFVIRLVKACVKSGTKFWVENPDGALGWEA